MTYRLGIDVGGRTTDWVALGPGQGAAPPLASGTVDSVVALVDGELRAGSQVAAADPAGIDHVTTDFAQRLGDAEPMMIGGTPYGAESLVGHLLASIVSDARAILGSEPGAVVLVHDDDLDDYHRSLWSEAGRLAGIPLTQLTLLSRTDALGTSAGAGGGGAPAAAGAASAAAGAAAMGWERHPDLVGPGSPGLAGGTIVAAAGAGATVAGGAVLGATVLGGEASAAAAAAGAGLGPVGSPLATPAGPAGSPLSAPAGPVGSPLATPAGPAGSPLSAPAGPTGTPLSAPAGPTGTPLSAPAGPTGTPLAAGAKKAAVGATKRSYRIPIIAGSIVAVGLVVGVGVLAATGDDDPEAAPPTTVVVETTGAVTGSTAAPTGTEFAVVASTSPASTVPAVGAADACTLGSWTMDNDSFAAMWLTVAAGEGLAATLDSVNGTVAVEVDADGVWTSTYSDWGFTASADDFTMTMSITGSDTSSGTFAPDGTFTFVDTAVNTTVTMTASAGGVNVPIPPQTDTRSAFSGSGNYVCEGDTLTVNVDGNPGPIVMNRAA